MHQLSDCVLESETDSIGSKFLVVAVSHLHFPPTPTLSDSPWHSMIPQRVQRTCILPNFHQQPCATTSGNIRTKGERATRDNQTCQLACTAQLVRTLAGVIAASADALLDLGHARPTAIWLVNVKKTMVRDLTVVAIHGTLTMITPVSTSIKTLVTTASVSGPPSLKHTPQYHIPTVECSNQHG